MAVHAGACVKLEVNGASREVEAHPDTPLLYVLRNDLGLTGARFGCGSGQCGACFVLVDNKAVASCDFPVGMANGKKVMTIEALGGRHPVQKALVAEQAAQCGYCLSGIVMSAVALLDKTSHPSESEVREALDRNLCRCGSHNRIVRAVLKAANG